MKKLNRVNERYLTNEGYWVTIINYRGALDCDIQFDDGLFIKGVVHTQIKKGNIKNPYHPTLYRVGYFGVGNYVSKVGNKNNLNYQRWRGVFERCYSKKYQEKQPTYKGCSVNKEWHNFQSFAKWHEENYNPEIMQGWALDKDILVKGNKSYSPETCCFVPREVNSLFLKQDKCRGDYPIGVFRTKSGRFSASLNKGKEQVHLGTFDTPGEAFEAYKEAKEVYIKEKADEWKPFIKPNVYEAMYAYEVEITD